LGQKDLEISDSDVGLNVEKSGDVTMREKNQRSD